MGRILVVIILLGIIYLLWRAFGPQTWQQVSPQQPAKPVIKGPDDDESFLWELEKRAFKEKRAAEEARRRAEEARKAQELRQRKAQDEDTPEPPIQP